MDGLNKNCTQFAHVLQSVFRNEMLTRAELDVIERGISILSRTGTYPFDWNPETKTLSRISSRRSWWKYATCSLCAVSCPILVSFQLWQIIRLFKSQEHVLEQGLRIISIVLLPAWV